MEQDETPKPEYQKGFNEGYTIAKYMPDLAEQLVKATGESERGIGFQDGRKQLILDQSREKYPSWLRDNRLNRDAMDNSKTTDKDKGRDIEPEP